MFWRVSKYFTYLMNSDFVNAVQVIRIGNGDTTTVARVCNVTSGSNKGSDHGVNR